LSRRYLQKEKFVITTTLLTNPVTGEKLMSKSLGTGVGLNESSENMFGKVMSLADEGVIQTFTDCTRLTMSEIDGKIKRLASGENPKNIKLELASEIVKMYYNVDTASEAKSNWEKTFSDKKIPDIIPEIRVKQGASLLDIMMENKLVESKTSARRLFEDGAIKDIKNDVKITNPLTKITDPVTLRIGKKTFIKILISN
jgi:tyrosyl-tRNA synthetase